MARQNQKISLIKPYNYRLLLKILKKKKPFMKSPIPEAEYAEVDFQIQPLFVMSTFQMAYQCRAKHGTTIEKS